MARIVSRDEAPTLEFDWEERVFRGVRGVLRRIARLGRGAASSETGGEALAAAAPALRVLAATVAGEDLQIRRARDVGGLRGRDILLPIDGGAGFDDASIGSLWVARTVLAAGLYRRERRGQTADEPLSWMRQCHETITDLAHDLPGVVALFDDVAARELTARADPRTLRGRDAIEERACHAFLRGERPWQDASFVATWRAARPSRTPCAPLAILGRDISMETEHHGGEQDEHAPDGCDGSEADAGAVEELRVLLIDEKDARELPTHAFEKVEMLDDWQGGVKRMDGADDLDDHLEALDELDLRDLVRGGEPAQALLRAEMSLDIDIPDVRTIGSDEVGVPYDEWDRRKRCYRRGWTRVYPTSLPADAHVWANEALARRRRLIEQLEARIRAHRHQLRPQPRQLDGEDVDLDLIVDELAATRAGHGGDPRLYIRQARQRRDVSTLVLLDISLSTDAWVDDQRVIDVARDAVLVLGEVSSRLGDSLRIMAFASHTRNQVRAFDVLGWDEPWEVGRRRIGRLEPQGYTRIGPAIRHATAALRESPARERLLLIVSDGKPTDYDRYEGRYGVADVRQAVREAERDGVHVHALAIESQAREYLPGLVGPGAWHLLPRADALPELLTAIHARLTT